MATALALLWPIIPALAQDCHDWDGDGSEAGWTCPTAADCADLAWQRGPAALEVCDGLDNDCDEDLDAGCDRTCDTPFLFAVPKDVTVEGYPQLASECAARMDYGTLIVAQALVGQPGDVYETLLYARPYDHDGSPLAPAVTIGEPESTDPNEKRCKIVGVGDRALVVWQDSPTTSQSDHELKARLVDSFGTPISDVINLSEQSPFNEDSPWNSHTVAWDGQRFAVFWAVWGRRWNLLMTLIDRNGDLLSTNIVTDDVDGAQSPIDYARGVWTGEHYVIVVSTDTAGDNLFVIRASRDGIELGRSAIPADTSLIEAAVGGGRILVGWTHGTIVGAFFRAAFLDLDGNYLTNPGVLSLLNHANVSGTLRVRIAWSGEVFGMKTGVFDFVGGSYKFDWRLFRISPAGVNLDPGGTLLLTGDEEAWELLWDGDEFYLVGNAVAFDAGIHRIVCSCDDEDGDQYDACVLRDCDDSDPLTNLGAIEACRGLADEDCDQLVDCDDPDCPGGIGPIDVTDLTWSDATTVSWSPVAGAERYDLARGLLHDVRRRGDLLLADCAGLELATTAWLDDGRSPPPGEVLWFLVRPEGSPCALGSWDGGNGGARDVSACR